MVPSAHLSPRSAIGEALLTLGDRWTLLILVRAFVLRTRRFGDWRDQLGLSESTLAVRLRDMVGRAARTRSVRGRRSYA